MKRDSTYPNYIFYGWLLILAWAPLPLGSNRPWALALLILLCALLALVMMGQSLADGTVTRGWDSHSQMGQSLKRFWLPILLLLCVPLWASLQLLPMSLDFLELFSPKAAEIWRAVGAEEGTVTLDAGRTQFQAAFSWALWFFFCATLLLLDTRERARQACMFIVYFGVYQALYGSFKTLMGIEYSFWLPREAYNDATGTFVNRNHLAGYLEMCLAVGIGMLVGSLHQKSSSTWRDRARRLIDTMLGPKMRLRIFLALMVIALVLTHSRMGNTAFFASLLICGGLWMILQRKIHKGAIILFASLVLVDALIVGQWFGFEEVVERVQSTTATNETRDEVVRDSLLMLQDYPLTGSGLGSYSAVFPRYQQPDIRGLYYDHAHNDYLEFAVELGMIGMLPLAALVLLSLARALYSMYKRRDQLAKGLAFAGAMGILSLLIHSSVDFNLQMPANAQLFIVVIALAWISGTLQHGNERES